MAEEVKNEEEENNTFGAFNNKYARGIGATVLAAIVAKNDPYLLEGFSEKIDELEKADRARRDKFIETATAAATKEIARNKLRRLERRQAAEPEIKRAVALGMNPYFAGQAYQTGNLKTILKEKADNPTLGLNELYQVGNEFKGTIPGFSTNDILEALAGPTVKLTGLLDDIKAPKRRSFLTNFIRGTDEDTTAQAEINKNIEARQPTRDTTTKPVDFSQVSLSDKGTQFLQNVGKETTATVSNARSDVASWVTTIMGLKGVGGRSPVAISQGDFVFQSDSLENNKIAKKISQKMLKEVEDLYNDVDGPAYNDRRMAIGMVTRRYEKTTPDGTSINISALNAGEREKLIPNEWTPSTPTGTQIEKKKEKKKASAQSVYDKMVANIAKAKSSNERTRERNKKMKQAKKIAENHIIMLMNENPPRATQADLDKVKNFNIN